MNKKIRVLIMRPGEDAKEMWIYPTHDVLTDLVGGEITMRNPMDDGTAIICKDTVDVDEEPSRYLRNGRGQIVTRFYGTIVVSGVFMKAGELDSLTDEEVEMATQRLERAEI